MNKLSKRENKNLELAYNFVRHTDRHVFLTGKAGTGKTTFLHELQKDGIKRMVTLAPTGVAAINARGTTIHSFFQMPFGPIIPEAAGYKTISDNPKNRFANKFGREKINMIRSIDLLVIDEISMVRADLLDGIDAILRKYRNSQNVFGGVQLLMVGDLQQLAPVVKDDDWSILKHYYDTPFFFSSIAFRKTNFAGIVLQHIYRQKDKEFIDILNKVRNNTVDDLSLARLNQRYIPNFIDSPEKGYIILSTHNAKARNINDNRLKALKGKSIIKKGKIEGNFPELAYPTDVHLELKPGAQVMFVKNDPSPEKLYFNGKIGIIDEIEDDYILVNCGEDGLIQTPLLEWENTKYTLDQTTKEIREIITGTFQQFPLKLAWAITIHKSQGLSFDKAIIDAREAFAHGQVYVALSRCRTLEGMVLSSTLTPECFISNRSIESFTNSVETNIPDENILSRSKKAFHAKLLIELFKFSSLENDLNQLIKNVDSHSQTLMGINKIYLTELKKLFLEEIKSVSDKFLPQLNMLINKAVDIEKDQLLQERVSKASTYFASRVNDFVFNKIQDIAIDSDNQEVKKVINEKLDFLYFNTWVKIKCLQACLTGFDALSFLKIRSKVLIGNPPKRKGKAAAENDEVNNKALYKELIRWRNRKIAEENLPAYMIIQLNTIRDLSNYQPSTLKELRKIKGIGKQRLEKYGIELLDIIAGLSDENKLELPDKKIKSKKTEVPHDTRSITLELFKNGKSPNEIAKIRSLALSTIEGHLAEKITTGEVELSEVLSSEKIGKIEKAIHNDTTITLSELKKDLGDEISYSDIRYVLKHKQYQREESG